MRQAWGAVLLLAALPAAADPLREAGELRRRLQYDEARARVQQVLPDLRGAARAQALLLLAVVTAEPAEARRALAEAAAQGDEATRREATLELTRLDYARGNYRSAMKQVDLLPGDEQAAAWRALSAAALGDAAAVPAALTPARQSDFTPLLLGWAALQRGDARAALELLDPVAARRQGDLAPTALLWKAQAEASLGLVDDAARTGAELRERFPDTPEADLVQAARGAARPAPSPAVSPPSSPRFAVQLGAFGDRTNAIRLRGTLPRELGPAQILEEAPAGRERIYRVVVGGFPTHEEASRFAAEKVAPRSLPWQVVPLPEDARR